MGAYTYTCTVSNLYLKALLIIFGFPCDTLHGSEIAGKVQCSGKRPLGMFRVLIDIQKTGLRNLFHSAVFSELSIFSILIYFDYKNYNY